MFFKEKCNKDSQIFILTVDVEYILVVEAKPWKKGNIYILDLNIDKNEY